MTTTVKTKVGTWNIGWTSQRTYLAKCQTTRDRIAEGITNQILESKLEICCIVECSSTDRPISLLDDVVALLGRDLWGYSFSDSICAEGKAECVCGLFRSDVFYFQKDYNCSLISRGVRGMAMGSLKFRTIARTGIVLFGVHFKSNSDQYAIRQQEAADVNEIIERLCEHKNLAVLGDFNEDLSEIGQGEPGDVEMGVEDNPDATFPTLSAWWRRAHVSSEYNCIPMVPALSAHQNTKLLDSEPHCLDNILVVHDSMTSLDTGVPGTVHSPLVGHLIADHRLVTTGLILQCGDRTCLPDDDTHWPPVYEHLMGGCADCDSEDDSDEGSLSHAVASIMVNSELNKDCRLETVQDKKLKVGVKRIAAALKYQKKVACEPL